MASGTNYRKTNQRTAQKKTAAQSKRSAQTRSAAPSKKSAQSKRASAGKPRQSAPQNITARQAAIQRQEEKRRSTQGYRRKRRQRRWPRILALAAVLLAAGLLIYALLRHVRKPDEPTPSDAAQSTAAATALEAVPVTEPEETINRAAVVVGTDVLAAESTPNTGGYNRTINLDLACKAIDGTLVLADEVFSFNETVGERTEEKGYLPASIYTSGTVAEEVGGGICQVASTLYLAALESDFEIVQRSAHQFTVSYMPLGMDASIYWGSQDLKFRNTSGYPVRIYAATDGYTVDVSVVGTKTDDTYVEMEYEIISTYEPEEREQIDWQQESGYSEVVNTAITGYYVQSYRCHYAADGTLLSRVKETVSNYNKRDKLTMVGPPETEPPETETEPEPETEFETVPELTEPTETEPETPVNAG